MRRPLKIWLKNKSESNSNTLRAEERSTDKEVNA